MKRDDIYDHLAQVYLGKRRETDQKKKKHFNAWLVINIFITLIIFASAFYGLTASLTRRDALFQNHIIYSLHNGPIRFEYNFDKQTAPVKTFALAVPDVNAEKYGAIRFSVRAKEEGSPGLLKLVVRNARHEEAFHYVKDIDLGWKDVMISLDDLEGITDWSQLEDIAFVLESWNVDKRKGALLIDNVCFRVGGSS